MTALPRRREEEAGGLEQGLQLSAEHVWTEVSDRLRASVNDQAFHSWFAEITPRELAGDELVLEAPNDFTRSWIEGHFAEALSATAKDVLGPSARVRFLVGERERVEGAGEDRLTRRTEGLNPKYTFDTFVIGSSNRFAHAAALAVAEAPGQAYNPLFIYGGTGLGKTHLLQAIAAYVAEHSSRLSVRYVTSETLTNDFINSIREKRIEAFKQRYRGYDVLLVDDIQFLEHKERIQEEFFHTFNTLYEAGRQIILSSDRPPRDIATLEERLRSRFEWGLIVDIQPPDLETRIAILRKKVAADRIHVPDPQVLTFIASRVSTNIRELEGALTRVLAFSSFTERAMSVELAQEVLKDVFPQGEAPEISIQRIQEVVSDRFGISLQELVGQRRSRSVVYPRHVAMYLCRELTDSSLPRIGQHFGGRDHTTVINATSNITKLIREDRGVYNLVQELTARIKQAS
jgi:chromosomal replication initiator protein